MTPGNILRTAAVFGFFGVVLGAFGAHALEKMLEESDRGETWETAVIYHLVHSVVLLFVALLPKVAKAVVWALGAGIILFSGSLYLLCVTGITQFAFVTPIGGIAFLLGWGLLIAKARGLVSGH